MTSSSAPYSRRHLGRSLRWQKHRGLERPSLLLCVVAALPLSGCGDSAAAPGGSDGAGGTGSTSSEGATGAGGSTLTTSETSTGDMSCTVRVQGDLIVTNDSDLEWLQTVQEVEGNVVVEGLSGSTVLEELRCLETVGGGLEVRNSPDLQDFSGLGNLQAIGERGGVAILVEENPALRSLSGLVSLREVGIVAILGNDRLERLGLEGFEFIRGIRLGSEVCPAQASPDAPVPPPIFSGDNPMLTELDGLAGTEVLNFVVRGQSAFVSTDEIEEVTLAYREKYGPNGGGVSHEFKHNPNLSESEIAAVFEADGVGIYENAACENRDDDRVCECPGGPK